MTGSENRRISLRVTYRVPLYERLSYVNITVLFYLNSIVKTLPNNKTHVLIANTNWLLPVIEVISF